jgi:hypothetical protein
VSAVLATGADADYGYQLLNLLGSVKANSDVFERIVVYDLGLSALQRRLVQGVRGVEVRNVPPFVPHWAQCFTWKPWIWTHIEADELLFLDAGTTVLRSLREPLEQVRERGYFVVGTGHTNRESVPSDYYELYGIGEDVARAECITSGIVGFRPGGAFFRNVIGPTFDDVVRGRNLGWSPREVSRNFGINRLEPLVVRDCPIFRHEQTLLSIHFYQRTPHPRVNDVRRYGGWQSPRDHPQQLIWNHRRSGDFAYIQRVPYAPRLALPGRAFGLAFRARWWLRANRWAFRPSTYLRKARTIAGSLRRSPT